MKDKTWLHGEIQIQIKVGVQVNTSDLTPSDSLAIIIT
jgi:hypothetical protein